MHIILHLDLALHVLDRAEQGLAADVLGEVAVLVDI